MTDLKILNVITKREYYEDYLKVFKDNNINNVVSSLCYGTATKKMLDYLGIEKTEKLLFKTMLNASEVDKIINELNKKVRLSDSGNGIYFTIPVDSIGGMSSLNYFLGSKPYEKKENNMETVNYNYSLIITIINTGFVDLVMNAARKVGAKGGTVLKGRGTGTEFAKFFGISISEEKQLIYIVANQNDKNNIIRAIMEKAGSNTEAHGVVFSLPVENISGLSSIANK